MFLTQGLEVNFESGRREAEKVEVVECLWDREKGLSLFAQHEGVDFFDVCCTRHGHYQRVTTSQNLESQLITFLDQGKRVCFQIHVIWFIRVFSKYPVLGTLNYFGEIQYSKP